MTDFQLFLERNFLKKKDVAEYLRVSNAFITQLAKGDRGIPQDKLAEIKQNEIWDTSMLKFPSEFKPSEGDTSSPSESMIDELVDERYYTYLLPLSAQGGSFNEFTQAVTLADCERVRVPISNVDFAIRITGDSMAPEYPNGSQALIKRINERAFIEWGRVYVLDTCNGTVIKKLMPTDDKDVFSCLSINPEYPPFNVSLEDVYGIYRVLMCMSLK